MKRWKCPLCEVGSNAPGRMAKDDSRRYCFPCSADTGKLVMLVCPSLEKKRATKKATTQTKQAKKRERQRDDVVAAHTLADGTNLNDVTRESITETYSTRLGSGGSGHRSITGSSGLPPEAQAAAPIAMTRQVASRAAAQRRGSAPETGWERSE